MAEYDMADLFEDVTLKIGEYRFRLKEQTHSLSEKMEAPQKALEDLPDDASTLTYVEALIAIIDVMLDPVSEEGKTRSHARTVLTKAYKGEEIGADRITALSNFITQKMNDRGRPTSDPASAG